jgi:hypothetical protein
VRKAFFFILAISLLLAPVAFSQSRDSGAIRGVVKDDQNVPLPGVNVTLTSPNLMGTRASVTDPDGEFRFPALPPGDYKLMLELAGFGTVVREKLRVTTTATMTLEVQMKAAAVSEEITVTAESPTVDVKSTETASVTLSNEILRNIPYNQFTSDIVNLAPGVTSDVAYGASQSTGIAYTMDGVNVADPDAGSAWVFSDHNIIEEAKIMGVGLPAEYGNFTGVIFNLVTKSGGNNYSGHFEFNFQGYQADSVFWQAMNNGAYVDEWTELTSPSSKLFDINGHVGGPIIKDKLWFYIGLQYYRTQNRPTGFAEDVDYKQPRLFFKMTSQISPSLNMNAMFQTTKYQGQNRGAAANVSVEACVTQDSPDWLVGFSLTKILSPKTFFDLKTNYFEGIYYLDPEVGMAPYAHCNLSLGDYWTESAGYYFYADRARFGTNASVTHYTEEFLGGAHEFKFGAEFERSMSRNRYAYSGTGGDLGDNIIYYDYYAYGYDGPYLAYQYMGYDLNTRYTRLELFLQDSWQVTKRLNVSLGMRYSRNWGDVKYGSGTVYESSRFAPRLGFTFDILGDKSTIFKAHYGQFTEAMLASYHDRMNPDEAFLGPYTGWYWDLNRERWVEMFSIEHDAYEMDPKIQHPYMGQWTVGIERELFKDTSFGVSYINRTWHNIIAPVDRAGVYEPVEYTVDDPLLHETYTLWERTAQTVETYDFLLTNISTAYPYVMQTPYRKYQGFEFLFNKRFSNRWQLLASYVYSKATGNIDNGFADDIGYGGNQYDPNFWVNADGKLTFDATHMIKLQGSYILPLDISLSAYFRAISGNNWTTRVRTSRFEQGRITFFAEPRGSNEYDMLKILDLRLEKIFTLAKKYRLGVMVDVFNVFNADTITNWGTRVNYDWWDPTDWDDPEAAPTYPAVYPTSSDGHQLLGITRPRQARVGLRLIF